MRVRDDLATMFCKRVATKVKKAKTELEEIRLAEREITEALIGNYRTVLKDIDADGPAQLALAKAAEMTAGTRAALEGLDEEASASEVVRRLGGKVSPALLAFVKDDPFGRYVITTFVKGTNMGPYEAARHIPGVSGHELSYTANRHFSIALLNEAIVHNALDIAEIVRQLLEEGWEISLPRGPGPHLTVPGGTHQPVRRVQHTRTRHPARGVRDGTRRRLHPAARAGPNGHGLRSGRLNAEGICDVRHHAHRPMPLPRRARLCRRSECRPRGPARSRHL